MNRRHTTKIACQKKFQILKIYRNTPQREAQNKQGQMNKYQQPPESNLMVNLVITFILTFARVGYEMTDSQRGA